MKKNYDLLTLLIFVFSCIEKPEDIIPENQTENITSVVFPQDFKFQTEQLIDIEITDAERGTAVYELSYSYQDVDFNLGKFVKTGSGLDASITIPSVVEKLKLKKKTSKATDLYELLIQGTAARLTINSVSSSIENNCVDELFAVNNNGHFFTIDLRGNSYDKTDMPNLEGGGSIANALDLANSIMYYNVGKTLYAYNLIWGDFSIKHTSNPYNSSYPRLAYRDGFFHMGNNTTMHKVNAETNQTVASYSISGFVNNTGGGDLAFTTDGDLYLACFSGLYKFTEINDANGTAQLTRISAENFPFQLTSMAIDREDRIFVGTNDSNSNLIMISKEDGAYEIVATYDRKINDLTAWRCSVEDLEDTDTDEDGIPDVIDDYPNDPEAATDVYTPSALGNGTYAFEDFWPKKGDYDFNDMILSYRYINVLNSENLSVRFKMEMTLKAIGAGYHHGFGIELDVDKTKVESITGNALNGSLISVEANGLEANQGKAVVIVFNDTFDHMRPPAGAQFVNTDDGEGYVEPVTFNVVIEFTEPIDPTTIGSAPFNPFIFFGNDKTREIHLAGKKPTDLADQDLFGTEDDDSGLATGKYYQDENNLPWAIHVMHEFRYPREKNRINSAYNKFNDWGRSNGLNYKDWYGDANGYRNTGKIYFR